MPETISGTLNLITKKKEQVRNPVSLPPVRDLHPDSPLAWGVFLGLN